MKTYVSYLVRIYEFQSDPQTYEVWNFCGVRSWRGGEGIEVRWTEAKTSYHFVLSLVQNHCFELRDQNWPQGIYQSFSQVVMNCSKINVDGSYVARN